MFIAQDEMRLFQGYDGTLRLCNVDHFFWKHQINHAGKLENLRITQSDIQVLPDNLRVFRPRHTYSCKTLEEQAGKLDAARLRGNVLLSMRKNITSECGEDGILDFIFKKLDIQNGFVADVGACDGKWLSQSYNLLNNQGWRGILIEKDPEAFSKLSARYSINDKVRCINKEATCTNLENIFLENNVPFNIDFFTIDIEGNDFHLWAILKNYSPTVVAVDFNSSISNDIVYVQPYNAISPFGSSLKAFIELGKLKSYELAAVTDWNAIFVRRDLFGKLGINNNTIDAMYYPPFEMRMMQTMDGCLHLLTGKRLMRQDYDISFEAFQVLPANLRGLGNVFGGTPTTFYGVRKAYD